jgi:hypothetical protein
MLPDEKDYDLMHKKLSFALIAAMAIASAAQAGDNTPNGNAYGHDKKESSVGVDGNVQAETLFREAAAAYEKAWRGNPDRLELLGALKVYHKASLAVSSDRAVDLAAEHKRINDYFDAQTKETWTKSEKGVKKVKGAGSSEIDTHSVCKVVTNADGRQIFVSARTKEEWISDDRSFLKNLPEGVTAKNCAVAASGGSGGGDKDKPNYQKKGYDLGDGRKGKCDDEKCD